jgi:hypothetical protein
MMIVLCEHMTDFTSAYEEVARQAEEEEFRQEGQLNAINAFARDLLQRWRRGGDEQ